jgi:hypothetical protein
MKGSKLEDWPRLGSCGSFREEGEAAENEIRPERPYQPTPMDPLPIDFEGLKNTLGTGSFRIVRVGTEEAGQAGVHRIGKFFYKCQP